MSHEGYVWVLMKAWALGNSNKLSSVLVSLGGTMKGGMNGTRRQ